MAANRAGETSFSPKMNSNHSPFSASTTISPMAADCRSTSINLNSPPYTSRSGLISFGLFASTATSTTLDWRKVSVHFSGVLMHMFISPRDPRPGPSGTLPIASV